MHSGEKKKKEKKEKQKEEINIKGKKNERGIEISLFYNHKHLPIIILSWTSLHMKPL